MPNLLVTNEAEGKEMRKLAQKEKLTNDEKAIARKHFEKLPLASKYLGNVAHLAFESWVDINSYGIQLRREAIEIEANKLLESLGYQKANPLEQILIQEIVICWLRVNHLSENQKLKLNQSHSIESGLYWTKQVEIAQKQFTRACESLAKVKKLLRVADAKSSEVVKNLFEANLAKNQSETV